MILKLKSLKNYFMQFLLMIVLTRLKDFISLKFLKIDVFILAGTEYACLL